jgi:aminoglycoside phosphotransferase (APT) family kinase protein
MLYWGTKDRPPIHSSQLCAELPGMFSAEEVARHYSTISGRPVENVVFYIVLAAFKLTIIGAGNAARARRGGAEPPATQTGVLLPRWALEFWNRS